MRMIMHVTMPHESFNTAIRDGSVGSTLNRILDDLKPETALFTERNGHRGGFMVVDVADASDIPRLAEPWFLAFGADVEFRVAMTPDDLSRAGLDALGKTWS